MYTQQYQYASPPMDICQQYRPFIDNVFGAAINSILPVARLEQGLANYVYNILVTTGYDLVQDFLYFEFSNKQFHEGTAQNTIVATIEFIIAREIFQYGIQIPEFNEAVNWVNNNIDQVMRFAGSRNQPQMPPINNFPVNRNISNSFGGGNGMPVNNNMRPNNIPLTSNNSSFSFNQPTNVVNNPVTLGGGLESIAVNKANHLFPNAEAHDFRAGQARTTPSVTQPPIVNPPEKPKQSALNITVYDIRDRNAIDNLDNASKSDNLEHIILADIAIRANDSMNPFLLNVVKEKIFPVPLKLSEDFINAIDRIEEAETIFDIISILNDLEENYDLVKFRANLSALITNTALTALKYRYDINNMNGFPFLSNPDLCIKFLREKGILEEIETLVVNKVRHIFTMYSFITSSIPESDDKKNIKLLNTFKALSEVKLIGCLYEIPVVILPWLTVYQFAKKQLAIHNLQDDCALDVAYNQTFKLLDEDDLYFDLYDNALNHYRVYRIGKNTLSPSTFTVEYIE